MPQTLNVGSRSLFVTLTGWMFIALGALASLSGLLQNATVASWLPGLQGLGAAQPLPLLTGLLIGYLPWVVGAGLVLSWPRWPVQRACCCAWTGRATVSSRCWAWPSRPT